MVWQSGFILDTGFLQFSGLAQQKGTHFMPEAIGKGIASYISALKDTAPLAAKKETLEPISRREPAPLKSDYITII